MVDDRVALVVLFCSIPIFPKSISGNLGNVLDQLLTVVILRTMACWRLGYLQVATRVHVGCAARHEIPRNWSGCPVLGWPRVWLGVDALMAIQCGCGGGVGISDGARALRHKCELIASPLLAVAVRLPSTIAGRQPGARTSFLMCWRLTSPH